MRDQNKIIYVCKFIVRQFIGIVHDLLLFTSVGSKMAEEVNVESAVLGKVGLGGFGRR